jgi:hypothetical protein
MSGLIMPILAIGGIVILGNYLTKKTKKHKKHAHDDSSSRSSTGSISSITNKPKRKRSRSKTKKNEPNTTSILKVKKSKKKNVDTPSVLKVKKSKKKKGTSNRKVGAFYKLGSKRGQNWRYHKLPTGWVLKRKKDIVNATYSKEVEFEGPKSERDNMIKYLEKVFSYLKKEHIVKNYKIQKISKKNKK